MPIRTVDMTSEPSEGESQPVEAVTSDPILFEGGHAADVNSSEPLDAPVIPEINDDPLKPRVVKPVRGIPRIVQIIRNQINPPLTAAERAALDDEKRVKLLNSVLKEEAKEVESRMRNALHNLGYSYTTRATDGDIRKVRYVEFSPIISSEDAHWLHVDMDRLPYGVNSSNLLDRKILDHLGRSVGHKVNVRSNDEAGIWFIVERGSGMLGLPTHVQFMDVWKRFPPTSTALTIPLGMTNNRKAVFEDLDDLVHILVAGETGGGKSNTQAVFIASLAMRNTPQQLQILLMDMKAGMEFQFWEGIPHLIKIPDVTETGIIEDPDMVYPAFNWLLKKEAARRMNLIRNSKHRSINDYNVRRKHPLPRLLVVCDEWGTARLSDKGKEAETELAKAVMLLRAAGIHIMIGTQTPTKEVLGLLVRSNLPTRIIHNCAELSASVLIAGDSSAMGLPNGRAILKRGGMKIPVQIPYLSEHMIKEIAEDIRTGKHQIEEKKSHDVTVEELLCYGMHNMSGALSIRELHRAFDNRGISKEEVIETLKGLEGNEIVLEGNLYRVEAGAGNRPRRLVAVEEREEDYQEEAQE